MKDRIKYGVLHAHTDNSLNDGAQSVSAYVARLKELGAPAAALTDHGIMTGILEFYDECTASGIKPLVGVEAYIKCDYSKNPLHLILMAKNYKGYQAISRYVTESNKHIDRMGRPCGTLETLRTFFGTGSDGYGNVIATSACVGGVIAGCFYTNILLEKEIRKTETRKELVSLPDDYEETKLSFQKISDRITSLKETLKNRKKTASKNFTRTEKTIQKQTDPETKALLIQSLKEEKAESENAKRDVDTISNQIATLKAEATPLKAILDHAKPALKKLDEYTEKIHMLQSEMVSPDTMLHAGTEAAVLYRDLFGAENFYMEIQYHGYKTEDLVYPELVKIARALNIPLVAANDAHMSASTDWKKREMLTNMRFIKNNNSVYRKADDGDRELYVKSDEELCKALRRLYPEDVVAEAMENVGRIVDSCNFTLSTEKHYPMCENADERLRQLCMEGIQKKYPDGMDEKHRVRLEHELSVVRKMGYSAYFLTEIDVLNKCKEKADNSIEIGPGRGSAAGSLICYLTGITERIDPLVYDLLFERFLNPERVSMPDIDSDFSGHAREFAIAHVKEKYGEDHVSSIMTKTKLGAKGALDYAGKLKGMEDQHNKKYFAAKVDQIKRSLSDGETLHSLSDDGNTTVADLLIQMHPDSESVDIIKRAFTLEGSIAGYSSHAAGIIIGDSTPLRDTIPLMLTDQEEDDDTGKKQKAWAIQADMVQAEAELGFIKFDFLGLKNLDIITKAMQLVTKNHGIYLDPYNFPFEPEVFEKIYASGFTNFVFQFESDGMKQMLREFKPDCFEDVILLVAAYRPGPMQFLDDIIAVKNGKKAVSYLVPELEPILQKTYGAIIYQEQVIRICTDLAGFSYAQADNVRRYMSKKKEDKLAHEKDAFVSGDPERNIPGCTVNGIPKEKAEQLFEQMMDFAKYAFNKAHAACYAYMSYMTAYLKYHYYKEYICGAVSVQTQKVSQLISDCREMGVKIYAPDINVSMEDYTTYRDGIIVGLRLIAGIKSFASKIVEERNNNGIYESGEDFIRRILPARNITEPVVYAGAMDCFTDNRETYASYLIQYKDQLVSVENAQNELAKAVDNSSKYGNDETKAAKNARADVIIAQSVLENESQALDKLESFFANGISLSTKERLAYEIKYLGMWLSGNPLDDYVELTGQDGFTSIADAVRTKNARFYGIITNYREAKRKSDGKSMAFFDLADRDGNSIPVCCFAKTYERFSRFLGEGNIVSIAGSVENDADSEFLKIFANTIGTVSQKRTVYIIPAKDILEKNEFLIPLLKEYESPAENGGTGFMIYDETFEEFQEGTFTISSDIMERKTLNIRTMRL